MTLDLNPAHLDRRAATLVAVANRTLIADVETVTEAACAELDTAYSIRRSTIEDLNQIGSLYFRSYEPGVACATESDAVADVVASFAGDYGEYLYAASPVVLRRSAIAAAIMMVKRAPWDRTPACPFIIELFSDPDHRRAGLATTLLAAASRAVAAHDRSIALRVDDQNSAAIALYDRLGFCQWQGANRP